ncbi:MAG: PEP-CTERM sorting domain-containing protein, partial [Planctomycetota bacterium]
PNGEVYATNQGTFNDDIGIFVWEASGDFVEFLDLDGTGLGAPVGILYTGNSPIVPEPTSVALLVLGGLGLLQVRSRRSA